MSCLIYAIPLAVLAFGFVRSLSLPKSDVKELLRNGDPIMEVRRGHAQGAPNIPLDLLEARKHELDVKSLGAAEAEEGLPAVLALRYSIPDGLGDGLGIAALVSNHAEAPGRWIAPASWSSWHS